MHIVSQSFNTPTRRFTVGQTVSEADIDGPLTMQDRVDLGQIEKTEEPVVETEPVAETEPAIEDSRPTEPPATEEGAAGEETDHFTA